MNNSIITGESIFFQDITSIVKAISCGKKCSFHYCQRCSPFGKPERFKACVTADSREQIIASPSMPWQ